MWSGLVFVSVLWSRLVTARKGCFVTLLYGNMPSSAVEPVRILGSSIRRHHDADAYDMVVLYTSDVPEEHVRALKWDGWIMRQVKYIDNPDHSRPYLNGIMNKFHAWSLEEYDRVVYMDNDCLVVKPVPELFANDNVCGADLCVMQSHSDMVQAGVLILRPKASFIQQLLEIGRTQTAFGENDQGILWHVTIPQLIEHPKKASYPTVQQVSSAYNANPVYYYIANRWQFPTHGDGPSILHFPYVGSAAVKPWRWKWYPLLHLSRIWWDQVEYMIVAERMSAPAVIAVATDVFVVKSLALTAAAALCLYVWLCFLAPRIPHLFRWNSRFVSMAALALSFHSVVNCLLPDQFVYPHMAWTLAVPCMSLIYTLLVAIAMTVCGVGVLPVRRHMVFSFAPCLGMWTLWCVLAFSLDHFWMSAVSGVLIVAVFALVTLPWTATLLAETHQHKWG